MNKKLFVSLSCIIGVLSQPSFAAEPKEKDSLSTNATINNLWSESRKMYIALTAGGSYSTEASISASPVFWDPTPEGYNNNIGQSELLGASIGYVITPLYRVEIGVDHRNSFEYEKYQSTPTSTTWGPRTRYFSMSNTTIMATAFINGSGISHRAFYQGTGFMIDPFFGAGLGSAFNTVDNLHSIQTQQTARAFSLMPAAYTSRSLAYQFSVGFDVKTNNKLALGISYRYLNAGNFISNHYIVDNSNNIGVTSGVAVPPWSGTLRANELVVTLKYAIG
jgi:opacity protein-like surface antigen